MSIKPSDTPANIAAKWLNGHLDDLPVEKVMRTIKKRGAAMERRQEQGVGR